MKNNFNRKMNKLKDKNRIKRNNSNSKVSNRNNSNKMVNGERFKNLRNALIFT